MLDPDPDEMNADPQLCSQQLSSCWTWDILAVPPSVLEGLAQLRATYVITQFTTVEALRRSSQYMWSLCGPFPTSEAGV
jgi:hypothetical protein